jgi:hypothetical protein
MERRGVDSDSIDPTTFHYYNMPTQRLKDHISLIKHLKNNPPAGWNKQLIVL